MTMTMTILQCTLKACWAVLICHTYQYYRWQWLANNEWYYLFYYL